MGFLSRVRLSRSDGDVNVGADPSGLGAFGTEETMAAAPDGPAVMSQQASIAIAVLAALVLIEAVPTALWVRGRLRPPAVAEPVGAAATTGTIPLASCESTPAPTSAAAPAAAPAPTSGVAARGVSTSGRTDAVAPVPPVNKSMLAGSVAVSAPLPLQVLLRGRRRDVTR